MTPRSIYRARRSAKTVGIGAVLMAAGVMTPFIPAVAQAAPGEAFHRTATYPVYLNNPGDPAAETVAEISDVTDDGLTLIYTDAIAKQIGFLDITDPSNPQGLGTLSLAVLGDNDDQPTSVAVVGQYVLVVVDTSSSFLTPSGRLDVIDIATRTKVSSFDLGGQPDSIATSPDGLSAAVAMENQRDEDTNDGDLPQLPGGQIVFVRGLDGPVAGWSTQSVAFADDLAGVPGIDTPEDPESEYVAYSPDSTTVALTLQENNGIVTFDSATGAVVNAFTAGNVTLSGIDTEDDGRIRLDGAFIDRPREPDAITWIDNQHFATANEGDWKGGTRGWTVFNADTGAVVFDSGTEMDYLAVEFGQYPDSRSDAKGSEPEGIVFAEFGGTPYVFVGSERANFVAAFDVSDPSAPMFSQFLPATNGPEGLLPIPSRGLLAISSETDDAEARVRASVSLYSFGAGVPQVPSIHSARVDGVPISWGALGALSADPAAVQRLFSVTDAAYSPTTILGIDTSQTPALIDSTMTVTFGGEEVGYDAEGIFARPQGGFWLAVEGAEGAANMLVLTDSAGAVQQEVPVPSDIGQNLGKQGLEGVSALTIDGVEQVWVTLQRELATDPAGIVRLGRYLPAAGTWEWFGYQLETTAVPGDWIGLSEIVVVNDSKLALIERDKLNGPDATIKRVYTVEIPDVGTGLPSMPDVPALRGLLGVAPATTLPVLAKTLAVDLLPALQATNGWTQEKLEGLTIGGDGNVFAVTDNDGVDDSTGETLFIRVGAAVEVFDSTVIEPSTPVSESGAPSPSGPPSPSGQSAAPNAAGTATGSTGGTAGNDPALAATGTSTPSVLIFPGVVLVAAGFVILIWARRGRQRSIG